MAIVDEASFPIDTSDRQQMLNIVNSCIGTKFTMRFGNLIAVRWGEWAASLLGVRRLQTYCWIGYTRSIECCQTPVHEPQLEGFHCKQLGRPDGGVRPSVPTARNGRLPPFRLPLALLAGAGT